MDFMLSTLGIEQSLTNAKFLANIANIVKPHPLFSIK